MMTLTDRQRAVLDFIARFSEEHAYPPTVREIGEHFDVSLRAVQDHVSALQKKGYISLIPKRSRSIRVLKDERAQAVPYAVRVPLLKGLPPAGQPLLCEENVSSYIGMAEPSVQKGTSYFAIRVQDDTMRGAAILAGDVAVVRVADTAEDGQIVAVSVEDALRLRRFYRESSRVRLQPEDGISPPVYCQDVRIEGVLSGIVRAY
ncbi:MAG TPA: repressor LexA [Treponema sp.]|nr:repressor LexA [Treponema sp.]